MKHRTRRFRRLLLVAALVPAAAVAAILLARPAPGAGPAAPAPHGSQSQASPHAELDAYTAPGVRAEPAAAAAPAVSPCKIPGIGDVGGLLGICGAGSGALGDVNQATGACYNPPVPEAPGGGDSGWIEVKPSRPPATAPAFGPDPRSTEYTQYGYAGLWWSNYGQSCLVPNVSADVETMLGNWEMGLAQVMVATDNTVHRWASDPTWMSVLTPVVSGASGALYRALFLTWAAAAALAVAISVMLKAHRSDTSAALTLAGWAVLVIGLVSAVTIAPAWAGQQAQAFMGSTISAMDAGFVGPGGQASAADAHDSLLVDTILYPAWLRGELGDPSSATAQQYGPLLFEAQALTWAQASQSPARVAKIDTTDQAAWSQAATDIEKQDPQAYSALQGNAMNRVGTGFLAIITAFITCTFDFIASLGVIAALLAVLGAVILLPAVGVVGMHHRMRHLVTNLGSKVFGMLINGVVWAAGAGVDQIATRALLEQSNLPLPLAILLLAVLPFALWMLMRSLRGRPAVPRIVRRALMLGLAHRMLRGGVRRGVREALDDDDDPPDPPWSWTLNPMPPPPPPPLPPPTQPRVPPPNQPPRNQLPPPQPPTPPNSPTPPNQPPTPPTPPNQPNQPNQPPTPTPTPPQPNAASQAPPLRTQPVGPRNYNGDDADAIRPTAVWPPGATADSGNEDSTGLYYGGAELRSVPPRHEFPRRRPAPRSQWSTWLRNARPGTPPCETCGGTGYHPDYGRGSGVVCPVCRGFGHHDR